MLANPDLTVSEDFVAGCSTRRARTGRRRMSRARHPLRGQSVRGQQPWHRGRRNRHPCRERGRTRGGGLGGPSRRLRAEHERLPDPSCRPGRGRWARAALLRIPRGCRCRVASAEEGLPGARRSGCHSAARGIGFDRRRLVAEGIPRRAKPARALPPAWPAQPRSARACRMRDGDRTRHRSGGLRSSTASVRGRAAALRTRSLHAVSPRLQPDHGIPGCAPIELAPRRTLGEALRRKRAASAHESW